MLECNPVWLDPVPLHFRKEVSGYNLVFVLHVHLQKAQLWCITALFYWQRNNWWMQVPGKCFRLLQIVDFLRTQILYGRHTYRYVSNGSLNKS
jgi:hypothetical protein